MCQPGGRQWDRGGGAWGCGVPCPCPLVPGGAGGTSGEQPSANFPWAREFRCPALTTALPACDTVLAAHTGLAVQTSAPAWAAGVGKALGMSLPVPPPGLTACWSEPHSETSPACSRDSCPISGISTPSLLTGSCRNEGQTQGMPPSLGQCLEGRCTGLSSRVFYSSKLAAPGGCKDQSCCKAGVIGNL